jgi:tryptophanyl-tRNA synthetase
MTKQVILTGLRANSEFHLGNYLGGILPMVELQNSHAGEYQLNMFVPDLHSFTTPINHDDLFQQILTNLKVYVAAGLDLQQSDTYIYRQSYIPAHSELTVTLNNFTYFGELLRMTQFKEKRNDMAHAILKKGIEGSIPAGVEDIFTEIDKHVDSSADSSITSGLFTYPVLMAADILLYGAQWVPVGEDQRQHLELTRRIAIRVNNKFDEDIFIVPHEWKKQLEFINRDKGIRIRSLRNPEKKMSKSISDPAGTILLTDTPEDAAKKIMSATTDSVGSINFDWENQPGISNLLQISALLSKRHVSDVLDEWSGKSSYGDLKNHVAEQVRVFLDGLQSSFSKIDDAVLLKKLDRDEILMNRIADKTLLRVQKAVGLRPKHD